MNEIRVAVVVPKRARVDPTFGCLHEMRRLPRTGGILGFGHEDAVVRVAEKDVKLAVVKAQGRGPNTTAMLRRVESWHRIILEYVAKDRPVHQIFRVENGQATI